MEFFNEYMVLSNSKGKWNQHIMICKLSYTINVQIMTSSSMALFLASIYGQNYVPAISPGV